jgi:ubiquinone/menaquinone biosynthesis C-methylase UbiE
MSSTTDHAPEIAVAPSTHFPQELARIRAVYERRKLNVPADRYSDANPRAAIFERERERRLRELLHRKCSEPLAAQRILDVGCGEGRWLRRFSQWGVAPDNLAGIDLLAERIGAARESCPSGVRLVCGSASEIPFADGHLDIILCMNVMSSILADGLRAAIATEMLRVLRPGGCVLWYDFFVNNPANPDVRGVGKSEIARLFPSCHIELARITVAAPLGRAIAPLWFLYSALAGCRMFCTHYLGWIRKR